MKSFEDKIQARPFVKWVGGKTQLLDEVKKSLPRDFSTRQHITYVEPFVGGGAVVFKLLQEYPNIERAIIQSEYLPLSSDDRKSYFIAKRSLFNAKKITPLETAALFIFLNRTCFNGLYRVNSKGEFNVPHGKYVNPRICDADNLRACSKVLQKVEILCGDFAETGRYAGPDTLYYFDPPYKPITETSSFTSYTRGGFDDQEQIRLRDFCDNISAAKSSFIASNSDPRNANSKENFFDNIYNNFFIRRVSATRMINSDASGRGSISEIMISNVTI